MPAYVVLILLLIWFQRPEYLTPPNLTSAVPVNQVYRWKWTQEKWTSEPDTELREARDRLDYLYLDGAAHEEIVARLKQKSIKSPKDRYKLFEWGYAAYLNKTNAFTAFADSDLRKALQTIKPPFSYEFMRMRYLVEDNIFFANDYLTALGERLAQADTTDYAVRLTVAKSIVPSKPGGLKKTLSYAQDLLDIDPDRAVGYSIMGLIYLSTWNIKDVKDSNTARLSIHWYNEGLKREHRPAKQKAKDSIIQLIGRINKVLTEQAKSKLKGK